MTGSAQEAARQLGGSACPSGLPGMARAAAAPGGVARTPKLSPASRTAASRAADSELHKPPNRAHAPPPATPSILVPSPPHAIRVEAGRLEPAQLRRIKRRRSVRALLRGLRRLRLVLRRPPQPSGDGCREDPGATPRIRPSERRRGQRRGSDAERVPQGGSGAAGQVATRLVGPRVGGEGRGGIVRQATEAFPGGEHARVGRHAGRALCPGRRCGLRDGSGGGLAVLVGHGWRGRPL
mmetsp:Transcript_30232/g.97600  ORF Transcript_30232/g.97600 Transcript_30232/m.97600 type:complete len:238 (-) Transcript_30232:818-1531(-)